MSSRRFRTGILLYAVGVTLLLSGGSAQSGAKPLEFEVASIHVDPFSRGAWQTGNGTLRGSGNLVTLLMVAYSIDNVDNIVGLPDWTLSAYYSIQAKTPGNFSREQTQEMERNLLAQRFNFSGHWTTVNRAGYALRRISGSAKLPQASKDDGAPLDGRGAILLSATGMRVHHATMNKIAVALGLVLTQPVENESGLPGGFEFDLAFERPNLIPPPSGGAPTGLPSIFTALRSVGLELTSRKVADRILHVDTIGRPSEN